MSPSLPTTDLASDHDAQPDSPAQEGAAACARIPGGALALAALAYAAAILAVSWPLARHAGSALPDPARMQVAAGPWLRGDLDLLVWILAWVAHALRTQPWALFQANVLHPAPDVLASSEHLLGLAPIAAPVFWLSGNALLTYNVTVLVVVWLAALATFSLVRAWTGSSTAALLAGVAFALAPLVTGSWVRLHVSAVQLFPFILLFAWRAACTGRVWDLLLLALLTWLQFLAGVYVAFELAALLAAFSPALLIAARRRGRSGLAPLLAALLGIVAAAPVALPYLRVRAAGRLPSLDSALYMVDLTAPTPSAMLGSLGAQATWPVVALAVLALLWPGRVAGHVKLGLVAIAASGGLLAVGPKVSIVPGTSLPSAYEIAMHVVPGFAGMRTSTRFLVLPLLATAVLAGIARGQLVDAARRRHGAAGARAAGAALLLASAALTLARPPRPPLPLERIALDGPAMAAQRWLRDQAAPAPVLELPAANSALDGGTLRITGRAMLGSTLHWQPLLNGYTGHPPPTAALVMTLAQRLPDPRALADLCALTGLRWIVVHFGVMPGEEQRWKSAAALESVEPVARFGDDAIFRVRRECPVPDAATRARLTAPAPERTLGGAPLRPLTADEARYEIAAALPESMPTGHYEWLWVEVSNRGPATLPGLATSVPGSLQVQSRWRDAATGDVVAEGEAIPLAADLAPGGSVRAQVNVLAPRRSGALVLEIGLVQKEHGWLPEPPGGAGALRQKVTVYAPAPLAPPGGGAS